jgi:hypothetical protein
MPLHCGRCDGIHSQKGVYNATTTGMTAGKRDDEDIKIEIEKMMTQKKHKGFLAGTTLFLD